RFSVNRAGRAEILIRNPMIATRLPDLIRGDQLTLSLEAIEIFNGKGAVANATPRNIPVQEMTPAPQIQSKCYYPLAHTCQRGLLVWRHRGRAGTFYSLCPLPRLPPAGPSTSLQFSDFSLQQEHVLAQLARKPP